MKKLSCLIAIAITAFVILPVMTFCQETSKDYTEVVFYHPKQNMMSGANSLEVKVYMNDKEIGGLLNGTKLVYRFYSEGPVKIKCVATFGGGIIGQPFISNIEGKHGESYYFSLLAYSMTGIKGEIIDAKKKDKMEKETWVDTNTKVEDKADPIIKK
jgi:hypothetical protein